jgi:osmotically-inducible protein OsmY
VRGVITRGVNHVNDELTIHVSDQLRWDPKVDSTAIAVSADDGVVTLRGTVGSFRKKREAKEDARRVFGVKDVKNELQVRILNEDRREDADLEGRAALSVTVPWDLSTLTLFASSFALRSIAFLIGTVSSWADHDEAVAAAWAAPGVTRVKDHLLVAY